MTKYLTPYNCTVVYDPKEPLEAAIVHLINRAQLITNTDDCEFISPVLIYFADPVGQQENPQEDQQDGQQNDPQEDQHENQQHPITKLMSRGFQRLIQVRVDGIDSIREFIMGSVQIYLLEYLLTWYTNYESKYVTKQDTKNLMLALLYRYKTISNGILFILNSGYKGFNVIEEMIAIGSALDDLYKSFVSSARENGTEYDHDNLHILAISTEVPIDIVKMLIVKDEKFDHVINYRMHKGQWVINLIYSKENANPVRCDAQVLTFLKKNTN